MVPAPKPKGLGKPIEEKMMEKKKIKANAYVLSRYSKLSDFTSIVGVYPTMELAEQAKVQQDEIWHDAIHTIDATVLHSADKLDLRLN